MRQKAEYALAWLAVKAIGVLPRPLARATGIAIAQTVYLLHVRLRRVGMRNLAMAFPETSQRERRRILRGEFTSLGRQLAEVCLFPRSCTAILRWIRMNLCAGCYRQLRQGRRWGY